MKMRRIVLLFVIMLLLTSCKQSEEEKKREVREYVAEYSSTYEVSDEEKKTITIECPDFEVIARKMAEDDLDITADNLRKVVEDNSAITKKYAFTVSEISEENIREAFLDEVSYDMMVSSFGKVEFQESWGDME